MSKQDIEKRLGFAAQGVKAEMAASFEDRQRAAGYKWQVRYTKQLGKTDYHNAMEIDETLAFATESAARKWADTMIKKGWYKGISGTPEKVLTAKVVPFSRPGVKAKFDTKVGSKGNKSAMIAKNGPDADASWLAWVVQHHGEGQGESVLGTMRSYSTEARAKAAALRGLETSGLRGGFARPTTKAKA